MKCALSGKFDQSLKKQWRETDLGFLGFFVCLFVCFFEGGLLTLKAGSWPSLIRWSSLISSIDFSQNIPETLKLRAQRSWNTLWRKEEQWPFQISLCMKQSLVYICSLLSLSCSEFRGKIAAACYDHVRCITAAAALGQTSYIDSFLFVLF